MADEQMIGADDVARKHFATAFRGFDQHEVRAFLARIAAELSSLHERERALRERLAAAEVAPPSRPVGEDELEAALGVETTRVLHAAREAASEIRARAEESVARLLREANDDAVRMRSEAESILARRTEEAEAEAALILANAEESAGIVQADAEGVATAAVEEARQQGREMVAEAQAVRERVLKDLARRRKAAATQLEQLLAGRERLLRAYEVVQGTLDEATRELAGAEADARLAAEVAGTRPRRDDDGASPEPEPDQARPAAAAEPEPEAEVPPEPEPSPPSAAAPLLEDAEAPEAGSDDRRSSSLRLLRRRSETADLPPPADDVEGVRIIRPDSAAAAPRPVAVPDLPAAEPEPEPAPEAKPEPPESSVPAEQEPAEAEAEASTTAIDPARDDVDDATDDVVEKPVDDLFARLRANRAAAVAKAEEVLAEPAEVEPVTEVEPEAPAVDTVFEARDAAVEPIERALTRAMKRALADEQNEVLDALRRLRGAPRLELLLPGADEHADRFASAATDHLVAAAVAGAGEGGAAPAVGELASAVGSELSGDLRARLERALDATSGDEEALNETISATYREWKSSRSEPFARHHVAAAYALGSFTVLTTADVRWVVDAAEGGCPDCDDNALAGPTPKGQAFPTGQVLPPAHAGCRCLVLPAP